MTVRTMVKVMPIWVLVPALKGADSNNDKDTNGLVMLIVNTSAHTLG